MPSASTELPRIAFGRPSAKARGVLVVLCDEDLKFGPATAQALKPTGGLVAKAAKSERFKGKKAKTLELVAPAGLDVDRLLVIGLGKPKELEPLDWLKLGGTAMGQVPRSAKAITMLLDLPGAAMKPEVRG